MDAVTLGSSLSLSSFARLGSGIPTLQDGFIGGELSVYGREVVGSSLSVLGLLSLPSLSGVKVKADATVRNSTRVKLEAR